MLHIVQQTKILALCAAWVGLTLTTGCGQKGPLYLPKSTPGTGTPAAPAPMLPDIHPSEEQQ